MEYYTIDGVQMPAAVSIEVGEEELYSDATGRDELGRTHLDLVRPNVLKFQVKHENLTNSEYNIIRAAINPAVKRNGVAVAALGRTMTAYVGPRQAQPKVLGSSTYWNLSFSLVEI